MSKERVAAVVQSAAQIAALSALGDSLKIEGHYIAECYDKDGNLKWRDEIHNLVPDVGARDILDKYLSGSAYTASIVMGLKGTGAPANSDTMASHASWNEVGGTNAPAYSGNRPTPAFSAAATRTKSTSSAVAFTFTSGGTVAGCFIVATGSATKDSTTGILVSAGDFSGGNKVVAASDVLNVTYSLGL